MSTILAVGLVGYASAADYYVAKTGDDSDGLTWKTAWHTIGQGIGSCSGAPADTVNVALGTYVENVTLKSYVTLQGGYDGETIIDGNAAGSVVTVWQLTSVTIDGFTITNGLGSAGGGVSWFKASGAINGCTITRNTASQSGGGIFCATSSPLISKCTISGNTANYVGSGGGGIKCNDRSSPKIVDCDISGNTSVGTGGGVFCSSGSSPTLANCTICDNTAPWAGGICIYPDRSGITIQSCTISENIADSYGAIYCGTTSRASVINSIFWGNGPGQVVGTVTITYSCIEGGWKGSGNIKADPLFASGPLGDYYLSQTAVDGKQPQSPCADTGSDSAANLALGTYYTTRTDEKCDGGKVDMGYHYESSCVGGNNPPTARIVSITPSRPTKGQEVHFVGSGADSDGTIEAWLWISSLDGDFGYASDCYCSTLRVGKHTISFKVMDDDGDWSAPATKTLTIR